MPRAYLVGSLSARLPEKYARFGLCGQLARATVHPDNVWALKGLHDCLKARGETVEIVQVGQRLDLAQARADRAFAASCFCAQAAMRAAD